ncbi:MAG: PTS sugar transporter subunit IIA [Planctomycetota bacterium]|nr:MAG: PTS sugar transporter subunit IIA [Planctomycetota bacterium]
MSLAAHLDSGAVLLRSTAGDKWELLAQLVQALVRCGRIPASQAAAALAAVEARERSVSTGMEQGIAVPHAALDGLERVAAALALLPQGLDFQSLDGQPARIVVLLLVPRHEKLAHVRTLTEVARRLSDPVFRRRLLEAPDAAAAVELWS